MSLHRRIKLLEADMQWLSCDAWLDRLEAFMDYSDLAKEIAEHSPAMREKLNLLPDGTPKLPSWLGRSRPGRMNARRRRPQSPDTNPPWVPG